MKTIIAFLLAFAWSANAAISTATKPHTIDSAATPKVSYVDDNDEALLDKINELIDTTNLHNSSGAMVGSVFSSTGGMRHTIDSDNNGTGLNWSVTNNGASDTLLRVGEDYAWKVFGAGTGTKLTLSDSILAATARISGLTASRLMATNSGSTLASVSDLTSWIAGTANQITSTSDGDGSITLSIPNGFTLPSASPTFTGLTLSGNATVGGTLVVTGKVTGSDTVASVLGFRAGSGTSTDVSLYRSAAETWYTPDSLEVLGKIVSNVRVRAGPTAPTFMTKRFTAIGNSFDNTAVQMENTDVGTVAQGRAFNWGITDVSATEGRLDLTQPGERTVMSVFSNGNVGIGSTTDGGQGFQVAGTSRFTGAATFTAAPTFSSVTASQILAVDASKVLTSVATTGSGTTVVLSNSPTLVTPTLGVASATSIALNGNEAFDYDEGSFTITLTGCTTSPTGTANFTRIGKSVTLYIPSITGLSNSTSSTLTGIPASIQPSTSQQIAVQDIADQAQYYSGFISASGSVFELGIKTSTVSPVSYTLVSSGQTRGIGTATTITYTLQ